MTPSMPNRSARSAGTSVRATSVTSDAAADRALDEDGLLEYEQGETAVRAAATDEHAGHE